VHIRVVFLGVTVVSGESLLGVGNVESTVGGYLKGSEKTGNSGGGLEDNVHECAEGALVFIDFFDVVGLLAVLGCDDFSVDLGVSLVELVESNLLEETTGAEETGAVGGGVVLQTNGKSVSSELSGLGLAKDAVSIDKSVRDLADDLGVCETNDKTVLG